MSHCFTCGGKLEGAEKFKCNVFDCHAFMHKNCCSIYKPNRNTWFSYCYNHYESNFGKHEDNISNVSITSVDKRRNNAKNALNVEESNNYTSTPLNEDFSNKTLKNKTNVFNSNNQQNSKRTSTNDHRTKPNINSNPYEEESEDQDELVFVECNKERNPPNRTILSHVFDLFKSKPKETKNDDPVSEKKINQNLKENNFCARCNSNVLNPYKCRYCLMCVHYECIASTKNNVRRDKEDESWSIQPSKKLFTCKGCNPRYKSFVNNENCEFRMNANNYNENNWNNLPHYNANMPIGLNYSNDPSAILSHGPLYNQSNNFSLPNRSASNYDYFYTQRMVYKKLPLVTDTEQTWRLFFQSYINSKEYFDDAGNITRIMNAIKCEEIKEIGGLNLFEQGFYHQTILEINARVSGSDKMVIKLYQDIKRIRKPENYDHENILKAIDKIRNFFNLIWKEKRVGYLYDTNLCIDIMQKLPDRAYNRLTSLMIDAKRMNRGFYIQDIMPEISKLTEETRSKIEMKNISERHYTKNNRNEYSHLNTLQDNEEVFENCEQVKTAQVFKFNKCFLPNHGGHRPNECEKLWSISGLEAKKLGLEYKRCVICGLAAHATKICPYAKKLICRQKDCNENHYRLYCEKRPSKKNEKSSFNVEQDLELENYFADCNKIQPDVDESSSESDDVSNLNEITEKISKLTNRDFFFSNISSYSLEGSTKTCFSEGSKLNEDKQLSEKFKIIGFKKLFLVAIRLLIKILKLFKINSEKLYTFTIRSIFSLQTNYNLTTFQKKSSKNILPTVKVAILTPFGIKNGVFLLDSGSTTSLINNEFANNLKAKGIESCITVNGINSKKKNEDSRIIKLKITRIEDTVNFTYVAFHTFNDLKVSNQIFIASEFYNRYKHLKHLELHDFNEVDGLIGLDNIHIFDWTVVKAKRDENYLPLGIRTAIGDCVMHCEEQLINIYDKCTSGISEENHFLQVESISSTYTISDLENYLALEINQDEDFETEYNKIEELLHLQNCSEFINDSRENYYEQLARETLERETKLLSDSKHFQAPILWKDKENLKMPTEDSYRNALKRFLIIEKYGKRRNEFHEYENEVRNLIEKKYAVQLTPQEIMTHTKLSYYVATFFIKPENKRRRMIFDFKSKVNGISYNSNVIGSLNLLNRIDVILNKAREGKFLIKGDIGEMFHQIYLTDEDAESMRFLFRFSDEQEIQHYKLKVLPFGCASSPTISQFVKNKIAESMRDKNPIVYESLLYNTYMDDTIHSLSSKNTIVKLATDLKYVLKENGFNMLKINSNSKEINEELKIKLNEYDEEKLFSKEIEERLLGYEFNMETDSISTIFTIDSLPTNVKNNLNHPSKRNVLQVMNSLFDPLGLFGYISAKMKILYKRVCENHKKWDEKINAEFIPQWNTCLEYYNKAKDIKISRWISRPAACIIELKIIPRDITHLIRKNNLVKDNQQINQNSAETFFHNKSKLGT
ncbi:hypothetical protein PVAND_005240 [Polypedilum vanderplanki]|uniref:Reverse transcriptase domain-containing protein n=1 Tax=Polypedilum vanderplanki TaxID=319348 RepID=A0A9J6C001_POLVA|nr:hypothetical protein PVAND_005240 [Polypedilum vanderplanki]